MFSRYFLKFSFLLLPFFASALNAADIFLEGKAAYFYPFDNTFRDIYGNGGAAFGAEATFRVCNNTYGWVSADYFHKHGNSIGESDPTQIDMAPLGFGVKQFFPCGCTDFYVGAGILATYLHMDDDSPFVIQHITKWGVGAIGKAGVIYNISKNLFFDLFVNASYTKIDFHDTNDDTVIRYDADLSGLFIGGAIGYKFGCR